MRDDLRLFTGVVLVAILFPLFVAGGFVVGAAVGCRSETLGGLAGAENDPCRDAAPAMMTGIVGGVLAWGGVGAVGVAVAARQREQAGARPGDDQAALVSPSASPKTSG